MEEDVPDAFREKFLQHNYCRFCHANNGTLAVNGKGKAAASQSSLVWNAAIV